MPNFLNPKYPKSLNQYFRMKRFSFFLNLLQNIDRQKEIQILDIGGTYNFWERMDFTKKEGIKITILNLEQEVTHSPNITSVKGDACNLSLYKNKEFDVVFSNSVIEHLYTYENQKRMADEVRRVGRNYFIQTPNYYFPLEPHWLVPFFQFLPFKVKVFLTRNLYLGNHPKAESKEAAIDRVEETKLLKEKEMKKLFPEGLVYRERILGLTKSIVMYRF